MKLIIAGSTGFVATEVIRQAVSHPSITSILALARRTTAVPQNVGPGADTTKLKSVVCEDFGNYPESVKKELTGADACIWLIAVTPSKSFKMPWDEVRKICRDYTLTGFDTIAQLPRSSEGKPLRFIYVSGASSVRDPSKKPWIMGDYTLMRGEVETYVLDHAKNSKGAIESCVSLPGLIHAPGRPGPVMKYVQAVGRSIIGLPKVEVSEIAATLIDEVVKGFEKETLLNEDLVRIGQKALEEQKGL